MRESFDDDVFRKRSPQSILFSHLAKSDLDNLIGDLQSKVNPSSAGFDETKAEHRNLVASMNVDSGAWLTAGMINKILIMSNDEFAAAWVGANAIRLHSGVAYDDPYKPLEDRYKQKINKYQRVADQNGLQLIPAVFLVQAKYMEKLNALSRIKFVCN